MGILRVVGKNFRMDKFLLKTVRPFHTKDVILNETDLDPTDDAALQEYMVEQVREAKHYVINCPATQVFFVT